jgi:hypothetical protein
VELVTQVYVLAELGATPAAVLRGRWLRSPPRTRASLRVVALSLTGPGTEAGNADRSLKRVGRACCLELERLAWSSPSADSALHARRSIACRLEQQ